MKKIHKQPETWGIFLQSTGELVATAKSRIGAFSRAKSYMKCPGYVYVERIHMI